MSSRRPKAYWLATRRPGSWYGVKNFIPRKFNKRRKQNLKRQINVNRYVLELSEKNGNHSEG